VGCGPVSFSSVGCGPLSKDSVFNFLGVGVVKYVLFVGIGSA